MFSLNSSRSVRGIGVMGIVVGGLVMLSCRGFFESRPQSRSLFDLDECPREWERLPKRLGGRVAPQGLAVARSITNVAEFHDCQKLLVKEGSQYGPLAAVFASERLDSLTDTTLGAVDTVRAAGLILNLGPETYAPLRLRPGFTCLYLWRPDSDTSGVHWVAAMRSVGLDDERCEMGDSAAVLDTVFLEVRRKGPEILRDRLPPVARWDWDPKRAEQYIGIACARGWCEVGRRGSANDPFSTSSEYVPIDGPAPPQQRVKGWYDEQQLAVPGDNGLVPSDVKGTVFPTRGSVVWRTVLERAKSPNKADRWIDVAFIAIDRESPHYKQMMNLDPVAPRSALEDMNVLAFCHSTRERCGVPSPPSKGAADLLQSQGQPRLAPMAGCGVESDTVLWVRIRPANDKSGETDMFRCAKRKVHQHINAVVPATARWRWLVEDETVWRECTQGCCEVQVMDGG